MTPFVQALPIFGSIASIILGVVGLVRPTFFMNVTGLLPSSPLGRLEMRAIFGGCLTTLGAVTWITAAPAAYLLAGLLWLSSATVKLLLMRLDKVPLRLMLTGLAGDLPVGLAMLSGYWSLGAE